MNFLFWEYSNWSDWKRFLFRWRIDDNIEEGNSSRNRDYLRRELLTCLWRRTWKEDTEEAFGASSEGHKFFRLYPSEVQKLLEDWLSSSSSWVSLGQVTRGIRQRLARSSYRSWLLGLRKRKEFERELLVKISDWEMLCGNKQQTKAGFSLMPTILVCTWQRTIWSEKCEVLFSAKWWQNVGMFEIWESTSSPVLADW